MPVCHRQWPSRHRKPLRGFPDAEFRLARRNGIQPRRRGHERRLRICGPDDIGQRAVIKQVAQVIKDFAADAGCVGVTI